MLYSQSRRRGEYTFLKVDKPDSDLFQSQWLIRRNQPVGDVINKFAVRKNRRLDFTSPYCWTWWLHVLTWTLTLFIQKIQLFPLEILDFFNEFLKSGIRRNEPYSEDYHKCKMYERNIPGNIQRIKFQSPCKHVQPNLCVSDCLENREL
jgi:hypothetical protein